MHVLCSDCGEHAGYRLTAVREEAVFPPDLVEQHACDAHRLDITEDLLNRHGNVTITEELG